jgi:hypothetical protein
MAASLAGELHGSSPLLFGWNRKRSALQAANAAKRRAANWRSPIHICLLRRRATAPHNLNVNFVYEFPFDKGRRWLSKGKWLNALVGGWQISGIYTKQSGRVFGLGNWFYYGDDLRDADDLLGWLCRDEDI